MGSTSDLDLFFRTYTRERYVGTSPAPSFSAQNALLCTDRPIFSQPAGKDPLPATS